MNYQEKYSDALQYIDNYWEKIILKPAKSQVGGRVLNRVIMRAPRKKNYHIIEVPYTCLVPNHTKYRYVFYWDSYFMFKGLLGTNREWVIPEMVENFIYIFKKYHIIPNFSHPEALGRSQAPFLTSMIFEAYEVLQNDRRLSTKAKRIFVNKNQWLKTRINIAKEEYLEVWESPMNVDHQHYNHKVVDYDLNRYGDRDVGYGLHAEQESGWDMTSRFYNRCDEFLPIDLNCFLYKYEKDFAKTAEILMEPHEKQYWEARAEKRKTNINKYMWNDQKGFYFDYDYMQKKQSEFLSLAGFIPLWAGIATPEQAEQVKNKLPLFKTKFGLAITDQKSLPPQIDLSKISEPYRITIEKVLKPKQWDYPNIWPPIHYMVIIGLLRYGFTNQAKELMEEFLNANQHAYQRHKTMLEKMDGETGDTPPDYWYPTQLGFGWTNAIFYRYVQILKALQANQPIYIDPKPSIPPYDLAILH